MVTVLHKTSLKKTTHACIHTHTHTHTHTHSHLHNLTRPLKSERHSSLEVIVIDSKQRKISLSYFWYKHKREQVSCTSIWIPKVVTLNLLTPHSWTGL